MPRSNCPTGAGIRKSNIRNCNVPVILSERSEWRDLLHSLTFHRKRNGKPLMLSKTHSLPFPFLFSLFKRRLIPNAFLSPRAAVERSDSKGRSFGSGLRPPLRMTESTAQDNRANHTDDNQVLPEVRDDVVAAE